MMNKMKIIYLSLIALFAVCGIKVVSGQQETLSDLQLRNVEALANEEKGDYYICIGEGNELCPTTGKRVKGVYILSR